MAEPLIAEASPSDAVRPDVILLSLIRHDAEYSSTSYCLAKELARDGRVFYVDNPFTLKDVVTGFRTPAIRARRQALLGSRSIYGRPAPALPRLTSVTPRAVLPINWLPPGVAYRVLARLNDRALRECVRRIVREHGVRRYVLFNSFNPFYLADVPADLPAPLLSIYQTVDAIDQSRYVSRHGPRLERAALERADLVLATSRQLARHAREHNPNTHLLPNAVDGRLFARARTERLPRPAELDGVEGEIVVYTGALDRRFDVGLVERIVDEHRGRTFVLVGPYDAAAAGLRRSPNVRLTGARPLEALPAYLQHADLAIIPFRCNRLTRSIYPLKVHEYLAAGLPVVATGFSPDVLALRPHVAIAGDAAEFGALVGGVVAADDERARAARVALASRNTWTERVGELWQIVERHLEELACR